MKQKILLLSLLLITFTKLSFSQTTTTTKAGNWSDATVWSNGIPTADGSTNVEINHAVVLDTDGATKGLKINSGASLTVANSNTTYTLNIKGNLENNGNIDLYNSSVQVANVVFDGPLTISGNTPVLGGVTFNTGQITTTTPLNIDGSVIIEGSAIFDAGNYTHKVAGNWTEKLNGKMLSSGTIEFDALNIQSITSEATFNNLTFNGGGIVIMGAELFISGNMYVTNNTKVETANDQGLAKDLIIDDGSILEASAGTFEFINPTGVTQTLTIGTTNSKPAATFYSLKFNNGDRNIDGDIVIEGTLHIGSNAVVNDIGTNPNHKIHNLRVDGTCNFDGTITAMGGAFYADGDNAFTINADIVVEGTLLIQGGDEMIAKGNVTVPENPADHAYIHVENNAILTGDPAKKLEIGKEESIYILGENNFPTGFGTIALHEQSRVRFEGNLPNQNIPSNINYGVLWLSRGTNKTALGNLNVRSNLCVYGSTTLLLGSYSHTLGGSIQNSYESWGQGSIITEDGGSLTLNASSNQYIVSGGSSNTYKFHDLNITTNNPTSVISKRFYDDIEVTGDLNITNPGGSELNILLLRIYENKITGTSSGNFNIGSNVRLTTTGEESFQETVESFTSNNVTLDVNSTIRFYRTANGSYQNIPGGFEYGNIELGGSNTKIVISDLDINGDLIDIANIPVLTDATHNIKVAGDWSLEANNTNFTGTNNVYFDGGNQTISQSSLNNVYFQNSGTKSIVGTMTIAKNLEIAGDATVDAGNSRVEIGGNWTEKNNGRFKQTSEYVVFNGTDDNQLLKTNSNSYFYNLRIEKPTVGKQKLTLESNIDINGSLVFMEDQAEFDMNGKDMHIGNNLYFRKGCTFTHNGGKAYFDGSNTAQYIRNYSETTMVFDEVEFSGSATKTLYDNPFSFEGDLIINNSILDGGTQRIYVKGNWINTGVFKHRSTLYFDGARNQTISQSNFHTVRFEGGNFTKTLTGDIILTGDLHIGNETTLDVGSANNNITLDDNWYNNNSGSFVAREGTVTFTGENNYIYTGEGNSPATAGGNNLTTQPGTKSFYNLIINCTSETDWVMLRGNLNVENNFEIENGDFRQSYEAGSNGVNSINIGANFISKGKFRYNNYSNGIIELNANAGNYIFDPGSSNQYGKINFLGNGTYTFESSLKMYDDMALTVDGVELKLNSHSIETLGDEGDINLSGGATIDVDAGASLIMGNNSTFKNDGGNLKLVGQEDAPASMTALSGNFNFEQITGTIAARNYIIERTGGKGIEIKGGTIDGTNNFSQGSFSSGTGDAYITTTGVNLNGLPTITGVTFNDGPSANVSRMSGNGNMVFENAMGTFAGEDFDEDPTNLVDWTYPDAVVWDGDTDGDGGDNINWNDPLNWSGDAVPNETSIVILDHSAVVGSYTVEISGAASASAQSITMNSGGNTISLVLNGQKLNVKEDITIGANSVLTQTNENDIITLGGNWSNVGTFNEGTSTVVFAPISGTHPISTAGSSDSFHNVTFNGTGGANSISSDLDISGNLNLMNGTLEGGVSTITIQGDWTVGGGLFEVGTSVVNFNNNGNQNINGGNFYKLIVSNSGTKTVTGNIDIENNLEINSGTVLDGTTNSIYIGGDWINLSGATGFTQTGTGTVIFNNADERQDIGEGSASLPTTFNHVRFSGDQKVIEKNIIVNGNMVISSGVIFIRNGINVTGTAGKSLIIDGGSLYLEGHSADNTNNFPKGFTDINISGGEVVYNANFNQTIYPTTYYNLRLKRVNSGNQNIKAMTGDITVNGSLTVEDVETLLEVDNKTINLQGNINFPAGGRQINWGNDGTLIHFGESWTVDRDIDYFNNIIKKNMGYIRISSKDFEIKGNMSILEDAYLNQGRVNITSTGTNKTFTLAATARLYSYNPETYNSMSGRKAFPVDFANYNLHPKSRVYIVGTTGNQIIYTKPNYGNLYLSTDAEINQTLDGNLDVEGNLIMSSDPTLIDDGHNINVAGGYIDLRNYIPSATSTITFDGNDQRIMDNTSGQTTFDMNNVVFAGSGEKLLRSSTEDYYVVAGNLTINSGVTVRVPRRLDFNGQNWTNNGVFNHTENIINFSGTNTQTIDPGENNKFYAVNFENTGQKNFVNNGIHVQRGNFLINTDVDMGALTHSIATERVTHNSGTWETENANFIFDRNGTQFLPVDFICNNLILRRYDQRNRARTLEGHINVNDLIIEDGIFLNCSENSLSTTPTYNVEVRGNFLNDGRLNARGNTFAFESTNTDAKTIKQGEGAFDNVTFNQTAAGQSVRTYSLEEATFFHEDMTIGSGATIDLNGQTLRLGNDDPNEPVVPQAEQHTIQAGGVLKVNGGAKLDFSCRDVGNTTLEVFGTLSLVGTAQKNALITSSDWYSNNSRIDIDIKAGGTIAAQYYLVKYMDNEGLFIDKDATVDPVNNLSNGTWSELNQSGGTYLHCNAAIANSVDNVTFNFDGTPTQGNHFNVRREAGSGTMTFGGSISGLLGGEDYEADPTGVNNPGLIKWPVVTEYFWTGTNSTDWFDAGNWSSNTVPTASSNAVIPLRDNNPIIAGQEAVCKDLRVTNGILKISDKLTVNGNVNISEENNIAGIISVENPASEIIVKGSWTSGTNSTFINGGGTVVFNAPGGSVSIDAGKSAFGNVTFNSSGSFILTNEETYINGNMLMLNGTVSPINNDYELKIKGDYINTGGTFDVSTEGTVYFDGDMPQTITNGHFVNLKIDGSSTKTTSGELTIEGELIVENTTLQAGEKITMKDNVTIETSGTFDDGGYTHDFEGGYWTGTGNYLGTGTIEFNREDNQYIRVSKFNNLILKTNGAVTMLGNVDLTGDLSIVYPCAYLNLEEAHLSNTTQGAGTFLMEDDRRIYVRGTNNFPMGFENYDLKPNSITIYDGSVTQEIVGLPIVYGSVIFDNGMKIMKNNLDLNGSLTMYKDATLDVTANNYRINIAGDWVNRLGGTFIAHEGEVVFDGEKEQVNLIVTPESEKTNEFYNLSVNKPIGRLGSYWGDVVVLNNLRVLSGKLSQNRTMYVGGNMTATSGIFDAAGTYYLNKATGNANIQLNGSVIQNLTINTGYEYILQDDLEMVGNFTLLSGIFNGNGNTVTMGNSGEVHEISGVYKIGPGGKLKLPSYGTFKVNSGGEVYVVGEANNIATVTHSTGRYYFDIENGGTIRATNYLFEYMDENGIYIKDGANVHDIYNFSYGTFTNPSLGGTCLRIENNQNFIEGNGNPITQVSFPYNPGAGTNNVRKTNASIGSLAFVNYSGEFAGEEFDNDPANLINWVEPPYIMWTGNIDNDWYKPGNWQVNSGPDRIPLITDKVLITKTRNNPVINHDGAVAKTLEVQKKATLTLNTNAATTTTLKVDGDVKIVGDIIHTSGDNKMEVTGNWTNIGTFTAGEGTVIFSSPLGIKSVDNGNNYFYNMIVNNSSELQMTNDLTVINDFIIENGKFNLTTGSNALTVKGAFRNNGDFVHQNGKLILNGNSSTQIFAPGTSEYYNIDIIGTSEVVLTDNDLSIAHNMNISKGTFNLNSRAFNLGDGYETDILTISSGGVLYVNKDAKLIPANSAYIEVNEGGEFKLVGEDIDNPAYMYSQSGSYGVNVNNGGKISIRYYNIQNTDIAGIRVHKGATIDPTNNFSGGVWRNGTQQGQYIWLENDFADYTVKGVYFHSGASFNVRRDEATTNGVVTFEDALGLLAGKEHELDDGLADAGAVRWIYTHDHHYWTGVTNRDWNEASNWEIPGGGNAVPTADDIAVIPDVSGPSGSGNNPIIGITSASASGTCYDLEIKNGGHLTIQNDKNIVVTNSVTVAPAGTVNVATGSNSTIEVRDIWAFEGTFNHGGSSTVDFRGPAGKLLVISGNVAFYNLELNSSGSAEYMTGSSINIEGDFSINTGIFSVTNETHVLNVAGNFKNLGTFNNGKGTIRFKGGNQNILNTGSGNLYKIVCEGEQSKIVKSDLVIENDIEIKNNITFESGDNNITVKGNWLNRGSFLHSQGRVIFAGEKTQVIDNYNTEKFYNFTLNNKASTYPQLILYGKVDVEGTSWSMFDGIIETTNEKLLTIGENVVLSGGDTEASYVSGPLVKLGSNDFVFPIGNDTKFARLGISSLSSAGTFKAQYFEEPHSDISEVAAGLNHVSGYEHWVLDRVTGSGEPIVTLYWENGPVSGIDNLSTLRTAAFVGGKWEDRGQGAITGGIPKGSISSGMAFTTFGACGFGSTNDDNPLNSYNQWTGEVSSYWDNLNNWTMRVVPSATTDAVVPKEPVNQPIVNIDAAVRELTINKGASLTINPLKSLTTEGKFFINGNLVLESNNTGNASLIDKVPISYGGVGNVVQKLYLEGGKYHYVSSSMSNTHSDRFRKDPVAPYNNPNFYSYNESDLSALWNTTAWEVVDGIMGSMTGYSVYYPSDVTVVMDRLFTSSGSFNTGDRSKVLTYTGASLAPVKHRGWNFVGNPFPAHIDWDAAGWTKDNIYNSIYFWNGENYSYHVSSGPEFFNTEADVNGATGIIPPCQGFFVKVREDLGNPASDKTGTLGIPESSRTTGTQAFWKKEQVRLETKLDAIRITVNKGDKKDETLVRFIPEASNSFDSDYDAFKLFPSDWFKMPQIYSVLPNNIASINTLPGYYDEMIIPIGFQTPEGGAFMINIPEFDLKETTDIYFEDMYENKIIDIKNGLAYNFSSDSGEFTDRFRLLFSLSSTDIDEVDEENTVQIYSYGYNLYLKSQKEDAVVGKVRIYNMYGSLVKTVNNTQEGLASIQAENLPAGVYIVKLTGKYGVYTSKVYLSGRI